MITTRLIVDIVIKLAATGLNRKQSATATAYIVVTDTDAVPP